MEIPTRKLFCLLALVAGLGSMFTGRAIAQAFTPLHSFAGASDGKFPQAGLTLFDSSLYGTSVQGGTSNYGTVYRVNGDGTDFTNLYSFTNGVDGAVPESTLVLSGNILYGTTYFGGAGYGTVFSVNTDGSGFTSLYNFTGLEDGSYPAAGLVLSGATLYGTTVGGGTNGNGGVFAINIDGSGFTNIYSFTALSGSTNIDGANPQAALILSGSTLYGTTYNGGSNGVGSVFTVSTNGTDFTNLYSFSALDLTTGTNSDGANPQSTLVLSGNTLYGMAVDGGTETNGAVFAINTDGTGFTNLHSFTALDPVTGTNNDGAGPLAGLVLSGNTRFGTTSVGGTNGNGTVFAISTNGSGLTTVYNFTNGVDGNFPAAGLALSGGVLYGTAVSGGTNGDGTVFSISGVLHSATAVVSSSDPSVYGQGNVTFTATVTGVDATPTGTVQFQTNGVDFGDPVALDGSGDATSIALPVTLPVSTYTVTADYSGDENYGSNIGTLSGGQVVTSAFSAIAVVSASDPSAYGQGGVTFTATVSDASIGSTGTPTGMVQFQTNGVSFGDPIALSGGTAISVALPMALPGGNYTVTANYGGDANFIQSSGDIDRPFAAIYAFTNGTDGSAPQGSLLLSGSTLYGTASHGGTSGIGTVFSVNTDGTGFVTLHSFSGGDGVFPQSTLVQIGNTLFGTTISGGSGGFGTLFSVNTDGTGFSVLHNFGYSTGGLPYGTLVVSGSTLYGSTGIGGSSFDGNIFSINTNGTGYASVYPFTGGADGSSPQIGLISGNTLFGTAQQGGGSGIGTVFSVNTNGTGFVTVHSFTGGDDGSVPQGGLVLSGNTLYGTTSLGGSSGHGVVFAVNTDGTGFNTLYSYTNGADGGSPNPGLILSGNVLYGTTSEGGSAGQGTVFAINTNGTSFATLYAFENDAYGGLPQGGLTLSGNTLYGTAYQGGDMGQGILFSLGTGQQTVNPVDSTTTVLSASNPSVYGQSSVTFSATVTGSGGTPTGTVQFQTNGVNFGAPVALSGGSASSQALPAQLPSGNYTVTASYSGDGNFNSSSGTLTSGQTVSPADSGSGLISSSNPSVYGQSGVTFTATVGDVSIGSTGTPTGTVQFKTNGVDFGAAVTLTSGSATSGALPVTLLPGNYTVTASYSGDGNFNPSSGTLAGGQTIGAATLIPSVTVQSSKPYDGTTAAVITGSSLSGYVNGDSSTTVNLGSSGVAHYADANVGTGKTVTVTNLSLTGSSAGNYVLSSTTATTTADITAASVTVVSGLSAVNKVYDGTNTATLTETNTVVLGGLVSGDNSVSLSTNGYTATFANSNATTNITVTVSGLTLVGGDYTNYTLTQPVYSANITPAPVTITSGLTVAGVTYGTLSGADAATLVSNSVVLSGVLAQDINNVELSTNGYGATFTDTNASPTVPVTVIGMSLSGNEATNYTLVEPSLAGAIAPATLDYVATAASQVYGSANTIFSGTVTGFVYSDTVGSATAGTAVFSSTTTASSPPGSYAINGSGLTASNYTIVQAGGNATALTINAANSGSGLISSSNPSVYGQSGVTFTATVGDVSGGSTGTPTGTVQFQTNGVDFGAAVTLASGSATSGALPVTLLPGNYTVTASYSGDGDFNPSGATLAGGQTIGAATLTPSVTVQSSKPYDGTTAAVITGSSLSGYVNGDSSTTVNLGSSGSAHYADANVGVGKTVTVTNLSLTGSSAGNYVLSSTTATTAADITAASVTVVSGLSAVNKVYDGTNTATLTETNTVVLGGLVGGDNSVSLSTNGYVATFANSNATTNITVTVSGLTLVGGDYTNYTLTQPVYSANITAAPVTITSGLTVAGVTYGSLSGLDAASLVSNNVVLSGVLAQDINNVELSTNGYGATFTDTNASPTVPVTVIGMSLSGSEATNYTLVEPSLTGIISPATLDYVATAASQVYGSANTIFSGTVTGFAYSDTVGSATAGTAVFSSTTTASSPVGGYVINGAGLTASNYTFAESSSNTNALTITAADSGSGLISSSNPSVYGQSGVTFTASVGDVSIGSTGTPTGTVQFKTNGVDFGAAVTLASGSATSGALPVTLLPGSYTVSANYSGDGDFNPSGATLAGGQTIGAATLTPSVTVQSSKPYDGTTAAVITGSSLSGYVNGDSSTTVNLGSSGVAHYADANVGTGKTVTVTNLSLTGSSAGNYVLSSTTATTAADITAASVTVVSGLSAVNKVYDGTNTATLTETNTVVLGGLVGGDNSVSLSTNGYVATFANSNATTNITVTVSGLTLVGGDYTNYTLTQPVYSANITPAPVTITSGLTVTGVTYGSLSGLDAASLVSNNVVLSGVLAQDINNVELSTNGYGATFTDTNVNAAVPVTIVGLSLGGTEATNYTLTQPSLTGGISKATLNYVATATNRAYGSANPTFTGSVTGFAYSDTVSSATSGTLAFSTLAISTSAPGSYAITGSGLAASNYTIVQAAGNATALTINAADSGSGLISSSNPSVYGQSGVTFMASVGDVSIGSTGTPTGTVQFKTNGVDFGAAVTLASGSATSGALPVTLLPGNYTVTASYSGDGNFNPSGATLAGGQTIGAATLTPSVTVQSSKPYDGTTAAVITGSSLSGYVNGDSSTTVNLGSSGSAHYADANIGTGKTVTVTNLSLTGSSAGNYVLSSTTATTTANITAASVTVVSGLSAVSKVYDGTNTATLTKTNTVVLGGLVGGDNSVSLSTNGYIATFANSNATTNITVTVSGLTLVGGDYTNYTLTQPVYSANITAAPVTITTGLTVAGVTYGTLSGADAATLVSNSVVLSGVLAQDSSKVNLNTNGYTATFTGTNVNAAVPVTVVGLSLGGTEATNYTLTQPSLTGGISKATLNYLATATNRPYGSLNPTFAGSVTGFAYSDTVSSATSGTLAFSTLATPSSPVGTYAINGSGLTATNYNFVQAVGNANALTITTVTPPDLVFHQSGSSLVISWPSAQLGWTLQTNSVALESSVSWTAWTGSTSVFTETIPFDPSRTNVFFRLVSP